MHLFHTLFSYLQYLLIRLLNFLYELVPDYKAYAIGASVTRAFYPFFRARRRIAINNILQAHITEDPLEADRIARQAFGHLAGHICEALKVGGIITSENWKDHVTFDGPEETWKLLMETPDVPVMILTGHLGVWEIAVSLISFTRPMIAVARKMNNPFIERFLKAHHFRGKITIIPKTSGFSASALRLWDEQKAAMTLVMDQHASEKNGIRVPFMGRSAATHTSPARLHLKTGAPIIVGAFIRDGAFRYRMVAGAPIRFAPSGNRTEDIQNLLIEINRRIEIIVRRYPEQYLWAHNRWR